MCVCVCCVRTPFRVFTIISQLRPLNSQPNLACVLLMILVTQNHKMVMCCVFEDIFCVLRSHLKALDLNAMNSSIDTVMECGFIFYFCALQLFLGYCYKAKQKKIRIGDCYKKYYCCFQVILFIN